MSWYKHLESKWSQISKRQQTIVYIVLYTIVFIIGFLITYSPFLQAGKSFVWKNDGTNQHYPYMMYVGRYLRRILLNAIKGDYSIPLFDISISSGDDVIGF